MAFRPQRVKYIHMIMYVCSHTYLVACDLNHYMILQSNMLKILTAVVLANNSLRMQTGALYIEYKILTQNTFLWYKFNLVFITSIMGFSKP